MSPFVPQVHFRLTTFPFLARKILAFFPLPSECTSHRNGCLEFIFSNLVQESLQRQRVTAPHEVPSRFSCSGTTGKPPQVEVMWEVSCTASLALGQFSTQKNWFVI